jgi:hypothetical protein
MSYFKSLFSVARKLAILHVVLLPTVALTDCQPRQQAPQKTTQARPTPMPAPEANVLVDEPLLSRPYAIIGGAVQNVGGERLEKLSVEIELKRRSDASVEKREVSVEPGDLAPGQKGKFSLKVLSEEWSGSRVVRLRSGVRPQEVAFKSLPGAKRPPERTKDNVVVVKTPMQKKGGGGDFINTPDTPYKVP